MSDRDSIESTPLRRAQGLFSAGDAAAATALLESQLDDRDCALRLLEYYVGERDNGRARLLAEKLAAGSDAQALVSRSLIALLEGNPPAAEQASRQALNLEPGLAAAHNHLGRALQNLGQSEPALTAFRTAVELDSHYPEAWHNLGHVLRARGLMADAVDAYRRALELSPAYRSAGLNLGITLFNLDQPSEALAAFESILAREPNDVEALVHAGLAYHVLGQVAQSRQCYLKAIERDPQYGTAHCYLGVLLNELLDSRGAIEALKKAVQLNPQNIEAWTELASAHEKDNSLYKAREALAQGLRIDPAHPGLQLEKARLERRNGDASSAVITLKGINPRQLPERLAQQFYFELGLALDRVGKYDEAIQAFSAGNQLVARSQRRRAIDPDAFENRCRDLEQWLSAGAPGAFPQTGDPEDDSGEDLCFLLSFPRSGTTLLDTFLNAHSKISSIEEMPTLERVVRELRLLDLGYPGSLARIDGQTLSDLRGLYRQEVSRYAEAGAGLILDKLPLRTLHAGLISRLFPRAKILFALRHPCDVVLSNFMQQYAENEAFIHFDSLAQSAGMYDRVFRLWQLSESILDLNVRYTRYEALIRSTEEEIQGICEFLGLSPEPGMFDENTRLESRSTIRTNSYQQVAEPIYRRSVSRWTHYQDHLAPYLPLLTPHIQRYDYSLGLSVG